MYCGEYLMDLLKIMLRYDNVACNQYRKVKCDKPFTTLQGLTHTWLETDVYTWIKEFIQSSYHIFSCTLFNKICSYTDKITKCLFNLLKGFSV